MTKSAFEDLKWFKKHERVIILDEIDKQLKNEPMVESRNGKKLRENVLSRWELKVGKYRVFYKVNQKDHVVDITAVGYKKHNRLFIRNKEVKI